MDESEYWQPWTMIFKWYFCSPSKTAMAQAIISFALGMLLSPWSSGIFWLAIYTIINEILTYAFTQGLPEYWNSFIRVSVICCSIFGYLCGRTLSQRCVTYCGFVPEDKRKPWELINK